MTTEDIPEDLIITIDDVRRLYCVAGFRGWLSANGYDIKDFLREGGMSARTMAAVDGLGASVVADRMRRDEAANG